MFTIIENGTQKVITNEEFKALNKKRLRCVKHGVFERETSKPYCVTKPVTIEEKSSQPITQKAKKRKKSIIVAPNGISMKDFEEYVDFNLVTKIVKTRMYKWSDCTIIKQLPNTGNLEVVVGESFELITYNEKTQELAFWAIVDGKMDVCFSLFYYIK